MVFLQFPWVQRPWKTLHSFTSVDGIIVFFVIYTRSIQKWQKAAGVDLYLCRRACRSECLPCWRSRALWDRWTCTRACRAWDTPRSRCPRRNPPSSSTCPPGTCREAARHTRPRATSCSTARCADLSESRVGECGAARERVTVCRPPSLLTHAGAAGAVQSQALGALAAEGALGVHALAVCAHAGEHFALVDVCGVLKSIAMQKKDALSFKKECRTVASPRGRFYLHR